MAHAAGIQHEIYRHLQIRPPLTQKRLDALQSKIPRLISGQKIKNGFLGRLPRASKGPVTVVLAQVLEMLPCRKAAIPTLVRTMHRGVFERVMLVK